MLNLQIFSNDADNEEFFIKDVFTDDCIFDKLKNKDFSDSEEESNVVYQE